MVQLGLLVLQAAPLLTFAAITPLGGTKVLARAAPACSYVPNNPPGPPPSGYYCNQQGTVKRPATINSSPASSLEVCRNSCLTTASCVSFSYGPNKRCITYSKTIVGQGFTAGNTGRAFYNRRCFKQVCSCPNGQTKCTNNCVDLQTDPNNCGACGDSVQEGNTCCSGADTDTQTDPNNCGACGAGVEPGDTCCSGQDTNTQFDNSNCGSCGIAVGEGQTCCSGTGVDTQTDPNNCGNCGQAVAEGDQCCAGSDTDTLSDDNNCGACGNAVGEGQTCCNGAGVDLNSDPNNCGACGNGVGEGQTCCNGQSVDLSTDENNCGACGQAVGEGQTCCSGTAVDTSSDPNNCGGCGVVASFGTSCCNGQVIDTSSDPNNCGSCGNTCPSGTCYRSVCSNCGGDFCSQGAGTPCGTAGNCNCVGIEGSTQFGVCVDVNDGTSCTAYQPSCSTTADCPSTAFCGNYQIACNCNRNACFPRNDRCSNTFAPSRIFGNTQVAAQAAPGQLAAKGGN